jgi:hypothetical protein
MAEDLLCLFVFFSGGFGFMASRFEEDTCFKGSVYVKERETTRAAICAAFDATAREWAGPEKTKKYSCLSHNCKTWINIFKKHWIPKATEAD